MKWFCTRGFGVAQLLATPINACHICHMCIVCFAHWSYALRARRSSIHLKNIFFYFAIIFTPPPNPKYCSFPTRIPPYTQQKQKTKKHFKNTPIHPQPPQLLYISLYLPFPPPPPQYLNNLLRPSPIPPPPQHTHNTHLPPLSTTKRPTFLSSTLDEQQQ